MKIFGYDIKRRPGGLPETLIDFIKIKQLSKKEGYDEARRDLENEEHRRKTYYQTWREELRQEREKLEADKANWQNIKNTYVLEKLKEIGRC